MALEKKTNTILGRKFLFVGIEEVTADVHHPSPLVCEGGQRCWLPRSQRDSIDHHPGRPRGLHPLLQASSPCLVMGHLSANPFGKYKLLYANRPPSHFSLPSHTPTPNFLCHAERPHLHPSCSECLVGRQDKCPLIRQGIMTEPTEFSRMDGRDDEDRNDKD